MRSYLISFLLGVPAMLLGPLRRINYFFSGASFVLFIAGIEIQADHNFVHCYVVVRNVLRLC
jgi:hypothetical protein